MTPQERIKADAAKTYPLTNGNDLETDKRIGYIAGATALHDFATPLYDALLELFALKELKDKHGKTPEYLKRQPIAWQKAKETLNKWEGKEKQVELSCMVCGTKFMGPEPQMCCSGRDCGCMGLPIEPIVCSKECYDKGIPPQKGSSGVIEINKP